MQAAGGLTKLAGKRPPAAVRDHLDKCLICDQLIAEGLWNRKSVYLSKKTRFTKARKLVPVHEKCVERGAAIAREQGYVLEVGVSGRPEDRW